MINKLKEKIRKEYILIRKNIKNRYEKSKIIVEKVKNEEEFKKAKIVALYKSLETEVNTEELIKYAIEKGKTVVLPKVVNEELEFYKINSDKEKLIKSKFGVEEPNGDKSNFINKNEIDLVVVPGLVFDERKNRLGFGKGYYDRFLQGSKLKTIGIFFEEQKFKNRLPVKDTDIKLDKIITDFYIYI